MKIALIKIRGEIDASGEERRTLDILRLKRKHVCVLIDNKPELLGMIEKIKKFICYGEIDPETLKELIEKRGRTIGKSSQVKMPSDKIADFINKFISGNAKLKDLGIKPFFRLSPPRGGFRKSIKLFWPQGSLGNRGKSINELIRRML